MGISDSNLVFPKAAVALDNGDLMQLTDAKVVQERTATPVNTMRVTQAGIYVGHEKTEFTANAVMPATGAERDFYQMLRTGKLKTLRIKLPGETFAIVGVINKREIDLPEDAPIKYSISVIGKTVV